MRKDEKQWWMWLDYSRSINVYFPPVLPLQNFTFTVCIYYGIFLQLTICSFLLYVITSLNYLSSASVVFHILAKDDLEPDNHCWQRSVSVPNRSGTFLVKQPPHQAKRGPQDLWQGGYSLPAHTGYYLEWDPFPLYCKAHPDKKSSLC